MQHDISKGHEHLKCGTYSKDSSELSASMSISRFVLPTKAAVAAASEIISQKDYKNAYSSSGCSPDQPFSGIQDKYDISSSDILKPKILRFSFILSFDADLGITGMPR